MAISAALTSHAAAINHTVCSTREATGHLAQRPRHLNLISKFRGHWRQQSAATALGAAPVAARWSAWFKFGSNGMDSTGAGIYGSQTRDDFDRDDVEQYFNYMGMLATSGSYDAMEALLETGIPPVDLLLLMAASEGDRPKIEELLRAGAVADVKDVEGRTAADRAANEDIKRLILGGAKALA